MVGWKKKRGRDKREGGGARDSKSDWEREREREGDKWREMDELERGVLGFI